MYDNPTTMTYVFGGFDFGAATSIDIPAPAGADGGLLRTVQILELTEAIATPAALQIGLDDASDADAHFTWVPTAAGTGTSKSAPGSEGPAGVWKNRVISPGEGVQILQVASATGIGTLVVVIDWNMEQPRVSYG